MGNQEFAGASALVANLFQDCLRRFVETLYLVVAQKRCRSFFDEFLVSTLQRAVSRRDNNDVAVRIGEALGFNVARFLKILLDETFAATKSCNRFSGCRLKLLFDFVLVVDNLDASTAATERSLDCNRLSVFRNKVENFFRSRNRIDGSGGERRSNFFGNVAGRNFVAESFDCIW